MVRPLWSPFRAFLYEGWLLRVYYHGTLDSPTPATSSDSYFTWIVTSIDYLLDQHGVISSILIKQWPTFPTHDLTHCGRYWRTTTSLSNIGRRCAESRKPASSVDIPGSNQPRDWFPNSTLEVLLSPSRQIHDWHLKLGHDTSFPKLSNSLQPNHILQSKIWWYCQIDHPLCSEYCRLYHRLWD